MRVGSLFSGIGGIELGFERVGGFETAWFVEWDAYAQAVLKKNWPGVPINGDVRSIDWSTVAPVDVLTGGFPCQPHSVAGKRRASADDRDLWPECRRAIEALKPKAVVFENVPGLLTSEKGEFFKRIIDDFYTLGYRPRVYRLSARAVGAPHLRKRVFIVAYPDTGQREQPDETLRAGWNALDRCRAELANSSRLLGVAIERDEPDGVLSQDVPDADGERCEERRLAEPGATAHAALERGGEVADATDRGDVRRNGKLGATQAECGHDRAGATDGGREWWAVEPDVGRVANGVPARVDRLKCLGNAVVPQVAEVIARIIKEEMNERW